MKRIFKYINVIVCLVLLFNVMITPVMAKEVDYVKEDSSNGEYNAMNVLDVFMGDNIVYKNGFVSIKSTYDDGVHIDYYGENGNLLKSNFFDGLYFLDGIAADGYIYLILTNDLGIEGDSQAEYYDSTLYLYKIDSDMNVVNRKKITDYGSLEGNIFYLALDVLGHDLINYVGGEICLFNLSLNYEAEEVEFSIRRYNTNLDYIDMVDLYTYIDNGNYRGALRAGKKYFPSIELLARTTIEEVQRLEFYSMPEDINKIFSTFYVSNLFTNKNIISSGVRIDSRELSNDYYEKDENGNVPEENYDRLRNDLLNKLKVYGVLKVMDTRENVLVEKEYFDYLAIISPKITNNYIVATGIKLNIYGESFPEFLKTDILLFDLNGNLVDTVSTANGEQLIGFQETKDGFVAKSINVSDVSACANIPREPGSGLGNTFSRATEKFGSMFNYDDETIQGIGEVPSKVFDNVTFEGESTGYCASCRTVVYNLDASLRVSNPTTGSKVLYILIGLLGIISLFTFTILKSKNN